MSCYPNIPLETQFYYDEFETFVFSSLLTLLGYTSQVLFSKPDGKRNVKILNKEEKCQKGMRK